MSHSQVAGVQLEGEEPVANTGRARLTLDDLVAGVFAQAPSDHIPSSPRVLQQFFFEMSQRTDLPVDVSSVLERLHFQLSDLFPFSRELEASLIRLQIGGLVSAMNPDYDKFTMSDHQKAKVQARLEKLPPEDSKALGKVAQQLRVA